MGVFLNRFSVSPAARSCLCRQFKDVRDLLEAHLSKLPSCDYHDIAEVEEEDAGDDDRSEASSMDGSDVDMLSLKDLLLDADERENSIAAQDAEVDSQENTIEAGTIIFAEEGEYGSTAAGRKFRTLLMSLTMDDIVMASKEGMKSLQIKRNETGSTTGEQKFKSLTGRWYAKDDSSGGSNIDSNKSTIDSKVIERNTRIEVTIKEGRGASSISAKEDYRVLGICTKCDGKWCMADEKGRKQVWTPRVTSGKYRVLARMIKMDLISGLWQDADPTLSAWTTKSIYILVDASNIDNVYEKIILDETH